MTIELHWSQTVHHDGSPYYVSFNPTGFHANLQLRLRVSKTAPITQLFVRTIPDGEQHYAPMKIVAHDAQCNWWQTEIRLHMLRTNYRFFFHTTEGNWSFTANYCATYGLSYGSRRLGTLFDTDLHFAWQPQR